MIKGLLTSITIVLFIFLISPVSYADDVENSIYSSIENEMNNFKENLPDYVIDYFPNEFFNSDLSSYDFDSVLQEKSFWSYILDYLFADIGSITKAFSSILALLIISSVFSLISNSLKNDSIKKVFSICSTLCIALTVFNLCIGITSFVSSYLKAMCRVVNAFLPLMSILSIMNGNIASAAVTATSMSLFIAIIESFLVVSLLPLVKICLSFSCIKPLGGANFQGVSKTIKTTFTSVIIFTMSIFMFIFSLKNIISQGTDTLSIKTARFAISSFVPIVGASINDALRTVSSSLSIIKNTCGVITIVSIALIVIPVIINLLLNKLSFGLLNSITKAIGLTSEGEIFEEANSICTLLLTLVACSFVLFLFGLTIFVMSVGAS